MQRCPVLLPKPATGVVTRPQNSGRLQSLVFVGEEVRQLDGGDNSEPFCLGATLPLTDAAAASSSYAMRRPSCSVYEPFTDSIYFVEEEMRIMRLDNNNVISLVAGGTQDGNLDGLGHEARFSQITALAVDGRGHLYVSAYKNIRKIVLPPNSSTGGSTAVALPLPEATVTTLPATIPSNSWPFTGIAYDPTTNSLLAATYSAVCRIPLSGPDGGTSIHLVAGDWEQQGRIVDGTGTVARFNNLLGILAGADGCLHIIDWGTLRQMDSDCNVTTLPDCFPPHSPHMAILPSGCLAVCGPVLMLIGEGFKPNSEVLVGWAAKCCKTCARSCATTSSPQPPAVPHALPIRDNLKYLVVSLADTSNRRSGGGGGNETVGGNGGSGGDSRGSSCGSAGGLSATSSITNSISNALGASSTSSSNAAVKCMVTVHVGDKAFLAYRALLSDRCEYFRWQLEGNFGDSSAPEVCLKDADPDAFAHLLGYMYGWATLEDISDELLRPTAELAGRLLMFDVCSQLHGRLLEVCCNPAGVMSDLMWAEHHNLSDLVLKLKSYIARHYKEVVQAAPEQVSKLALHSPELAAQVMLAVAAEM